MAALSDVPIVHLGFLRTRAAYRKDLITAKNGVKFRDDDRLITFKPL
jgi:hypothetical protein